MTERLEQADSYLKSFKSSVAEVKDGGKQVALKESAFYPTSGGQLFDTGSLNGIPVVDVVKDGGQVWHTLDGNLNVGTEVEGYINWPRRYRHMQRHTAQHLVSQAFLRVDPVFETRSVSLSSPVCTVDFAGEPQEGDLGSAQKLVNDICYQNLSVHSFTVSDAEVGKYPLRRPPKVSGQIRLVQMGDWELSACGGTHLRSAAEALPIKLLGLERVKGNLRRVSFAAGWDALEDYDLKHGVTRYLGQSLSSPPTDLPDQVARLQVALRESQTAAKARLEQLATLQAEHLLQQAETVAGLKLIVLTLDDADLAPLLAAQLSKHEDVVALTGFQASGRASYLFMRSEALDIDVNALLQVALPFIGGRGGGKPDRAQGGGSDVSGLEEGLEAARRALLASHN